MKRLPLIAILVLAVCTHTVAQPDNSLLFKTIKAKDSMLFNEGFNRCNVKIFEDLVSDNFEMYHDEAGATLSKTAFIAGIKDGLCKLNYKPIRRLIDTSLRIYPLLNKGVLYGAVESGEHQFYAVEKGKPEYLTSTAKFTQVWLLENGQWKLSRVFSYNHILPH